MPYNHLLPLVPATFGCVYTLYVDNVEYNCNALCEQRVHQLTQLFLWDKVLLCNWPPSCNFLFSILQTLMHKKSMPRPLVLQGTTRVQSLQSVGANYAGSEILQLSSPDIYHVPCASPSHNPYIAVSTMARRFSNNKFFKWWKWAFQLFALCVITINWAPNSWQMIW